MAKYESPIMIICELQRRGITNIPERRAITSIHHKFLETGSVGDRADTRRSSTRKLLVHIASRMKQPIDKIIKKLALFNYAKKKT